jgi:hypothetical protein
VRAINRSAISGASALAEYAGCQTLTKALTPVPPSSDSRSTHNVRNPAHPAVIAAPAPPEPPPMIAKSK